MPLSPGSAGDPFELARFVDAQQDVHAQDERTLHLLGLDAP